jgi:hypothetical protein
MDLLAICRLQKTPCYNEIVRKLTLGQSVRSLAIWLAAQRYDGPHGQWSMYYWEKLLGPLRDQILKAKLRAEREARRKASHPPPPTTEKIAEVLDKIMDPAMDVMNAMPKSAHEVWKHVDKITEALTAERILKYGFLRQQERVETMMELEGKFHLLLPNGHKEIETLVKLAAELVRLEALHGPAANMANPDVVPESEIAIKMRKFDEVDRNLIRSASLKVISMIQREASQQKASGSDAGRLDPDDKTEATTKQSETEDSSVESLGGGGRNYL